MQSVLGSLIDEAQGAFVKGTAIVDNVLVCQGLVRGYKRGGGMPRCLMKLDLKKTYDMLSWDFIHAMLIELRFPADYVNWIMSCITTPKFSLLMNGSLVGFFSSRRGIRQGDPMSPYILVLAMEYLSRLLKGLQNNHQFAFHPKCKALKLCHLIFADDIMMFCKAEEKSILLMKQCLDEFSKASGLKVNFQKSQVFFAAVHTSLKDVLLRQIGCVEGDLPVKYLGVPLIAGKLSVVDCNPVIMKIRRKLEKWSSKSLTYSGRLQLVNSVIFHYQTYWSMIFVLPKGVLNQIEAMCRKFLWSGQVEENAMALVAWDQVCVPKEEGGLAVKKLNTWNSAAVGCQLWKVIAKQNCLWVRWVQEVYLKEACIWTVSQRVNDPWTWRKLLKMRRKFYPYVESIVGDGRETSLFYDWWLKSGPIIGAMSGNMLWNKNLKVSSWRQGKEWSIPGTFKRRYPDIVREIEAMELTEHSDAVKWRLNLSGHYTIASFYQQIRGRKSKVNCYRLIWSGKSPQKFRFIAWLIVHQRLKTKDLLQRRGVVVDSKCVLCNVEDESCLHLYFECSYSSLVWRMVLRSMCEIRRNPSTWDREMRWLRVECKGRSRRSKLLRLVWLCTVYSIWLERNRRIFRQISKDPGILIQSISRTVNMVA